MCRLWEACRKCIQIASYHQINHRHEGALINKNFYCITFWWFVSITFELFLIQTMKFVLITSSTIAQCINGCNGTKTFNWWCSGSDFSSSNHHAGNLKWIIFNLKMFYRCDNLYKVNINWPFLQHILEELFICCNLIPFYVET